MSNDVSMIQECVASYVVDECADGSITISIKIPERFKDLWVIKLSSLTATEKELEEYTS